MQARRVWPAVNVDDSANNLIGGATAAARNIISGNAGDGVFVSGASAQGNVISGNYVGVDATGTRALGNGRSGVLTGAANGSARLSARQPHRRADPGGAQRHRGQPQL